MDVRSDRLLVEAARYLVCMGLVRRLDMNLDMKLDRTGASFR